MKSIIHIATVLLAAVMAAPHAFAADNGDGKDLDVKEIVIEHLGDSYWWHIGKFGDKEVNIALPVIVRGDNGEWHCFSSGHLYDGASYEGFSIAGDGKYKGKIVETLADGSTDRPFDLSVTKTTAGLLLNSLITILLILCAARWYRSHKSRESAPGGFTGMMEMVIDYPYSWPSFTECRIVLRVHVHCHCFHMPHPLISHQGKEMIRLLL